VLFSLNIKITAKVKKVRTKSMQFKRLRNSKRRRSGPLNHLPTLKAAEDPLVKEAMQRSGNNQTIATELLGIAQSSLNRRLKNLEKG
jgi:DNA-binding protein Fis